METTTCTTTGFSSLPTNSEGQTNTSRTSTEIGSSRGTNSVLVEHETRQDCDNGCENNSESQKRQYYANEHPLQAATTALLNVASEDFHNRHNQFNKDDKITWNDKDEEEGQARVSLITVNTEAFLRNSLTIGQQQQQQLSPANQRLRNNNNNDESQQQQQQQQQPHSNQVGVVRLAGASSSSTIKMEYPHHNDGDNGGGPTVVMTSSNGHHHHDGVVMHSQHVEVIKTAGHVAPLHTSMSNDHHHHHNQHLSPKEMDGQNNAQMLQEMKNMRVPVYDPYQGRPGAIYGQMSAGVYDSLAPTAQAAYGSLTALQPTQHILQPSYANLLATTGQDYYNSYDANNYYSRMRPLPSMHQTETTQELIDRLNRQTQPVEMPSPVDSGIGPELMITPKQEIHDNSNFLYTDLHPNIIHSLQQQQQQRSVKDCSSPISSSSNDRIVTNRESPVNIPKIVSLLGFQYTLEAPISTSVRKDDDRLTYINKGQFYTVSLDYIHDASKPLKSMTVKTIMLIVFREDKPYDEEIKCWQFWHARQHSVKQRILDVDAKNSSGIVGPVEEIAHNAIAFYWNPAEQPAKVNVAVQCLSTDFSNQKGVKGLPLHLQVDTFDEADNKNMPFHRGYCQIKVFCDKGANRKMLHEQRRDEKRRMQGRKKTDGEYYENCDRSEFYHMSDLTKPAVLFAPPEDYDRAFTSLDAFYTTIEGPNAMSNHQIIKDDATSGESRSPPIKKRKLNPSNRVMIYVRKSDEQIFTPLHLVPPSVESILKSVGDKYNVDKSRITGVYKQSAKGFTVKMDDDMVRHYCNEDSFMLHFNTSDEGSTYSVTLAELDVMNSSPCSSPS